MGASFHFSLMSDLVSLQCLKLKADTQDYLERTHKLCDRVIDSWAEPDLPWAEIYQELYSAGRGNGKAREALTSKGDPFHGMLIGTKDNVPTDRVEGITLEHWEKLRSKAAAGIDNYRVSPDQRVTIRL